MPYAYFPHEESVLVQFHSLQPEVIIPLFSMAGFHVYVVLILLILISLFFIIFFFLLCKKFLLVQTSLFRRAFKRMNINPTLLYY